MTRKNIKVVSEHDIEPKHIVDGEISKRLITRSGDGSERISLAVVTMEAGLTKEEGEDDKDNIAFVLEGASTLSWDDKTVELRPGSAVYIPAGCRCVFAITERMKLAVVVSPPRI